MAAGSRSENAAAVGPVPGAGLGTSGAVAIGGALLVVLLVPWLGWRVGLAVEEATRQLDPDGAFTYIFAHHAIELAAALAIIAILGGPRSRWGLQLGDWRLGLWIVAAFAGVYLVLTVAVDLVPYLLSGSPPGLAYWPNPVNVAGTLAFQWLFVGVAEEVMFRGLILGLLLPSFGRRLHLWRLEVSVAGLLTAALFAAAHAITYDPAAIFLPGIQPSWAVVGWAFLLGVYYAAVRERTGSLLAPILSHNISDGLWLSMTYLAVAAT